MTPRASSTPAPALEEAKKQTKLDEQSLALFRLMSDNLRRVSDRISPAGAALPAIPPMPAPPRMPAPYPVLPPIPIPPTSLRPTPAPATTTPASAVPSFSPPSAAASTAARPPVDTYPVRTGPDPLPLQNMPTPLPAPIPLAPLPVVTGAATGDDCRCIEPVLAKMDKIIAALGKGPIAAASGGAGGGNAESVGKAEGKGAGSGGMKTATASLVDGFNRVSIAVRLAQSQLQGLANSAASYVQAFSPAPVLAMHQAMYDLQATVGVALVPVVRTATETFRTVADVMLPVSRQLAPVLAEAGGLFSGFADRAADVFGRAAEAAMPMVRSLVVVGEALAPLGSALLANVEAMGQVGEAIGTVVASLAQALSPVMNLIASTVEGLAQPLRAFGVIVSGIAELAKGVIESIAAALGFDSLADASKGVRDSFGQLAQGAVITSAHLAKLLLSQQASTRYIDAIIKAVRPPDRADSTGIGAARNPVIGGLADYGRAIAQAAMLASDAGSGARKTQEDYLAAAADRLEEIRDGQDELADTIADAIEGAVNRLLEKLNPLAGKYETVSDGLAGAINGATFGYLGR